MKKRILFAISTLLVLGLAIAAFALTGTKTSNKSADCCAMDCCKKSDSCPMKNKDKNASGTEKAACCDRDDCCCKGGSCPMKNKENKGAEHENCPMKKDKETTSASVEMKNVVVVSDGENCCGSGADCCKNGGSACCKGKHG